MWIERARTCVRPAIRTSRAAERPVAIARARRVACGAAGPILALAACGLPPREPPPPRRASDHFTEARLGLDATGHTYAAAIERDPAGERVTVRVSKDFGMSWDFLKPFPVGAFGSRRHLDLCTGAAGEIYVVWVEEQGGPAEVRLNRSLDGGATWLPEAVRVAGNSTPSAHAAFPRVRCDDRGNVYVVWLDDREGFAAIYANRSRDAGTTWLAFDRRVTPLSLGRKAAPELGCDRDGNLYAIWPEEISGRWQIVTNVSTDHGETWGIREQPVSSGTRALYGEVAALDGGVAVVAWIEEGRSGGRIFTARTTDRGRTWETPRALGGTTIGTASPPRVVQGDRTEVYVAWQVTRSRTDARIVVAGSRDSGARFGEVLLQRPPGLGTGIVDLQPVTIEVPFGVAGDRSGNLYVTWLETTVGAVRLGFDRVSDSGRTWVRPQPDLDLEARLDLSFSEGWVPSLVPELAASDFGHVCLLWNIGHTLYVAASPFNGDSGWRVTTF